MFKEFVFIAFLQSIACIEDSGTRIFGIGYGSFLIIISIILGLLICIFAQTTRHPEIYSIVALILPIFFILFFVFVPKKSTNITPLVTITDSSFIPHIIFAVLILLMSVISLSLYALDKLMVYKRAKNIARTGVICVSHIQQQNRTFNREITSQDNSQLQLIRQHLQQ